LSASSRSTMAILSVHYDRSLNQHIDPGWFLETSLTKPSYINNALDGALAKKAIKKLGALAPDEMLTFEPALALGGAHELKYVKRSK
jgi:hypothetical protein